MMRRARCFIFTTSSKVLSKWTRDHFQTRTGRTCRLSLRVLAPGFNIMLSPSSLLFVRGVVRLHHLLALRIHRHFRLTLHIGNLRISSSLALPRSTTARNGDLLVHVRRLPATAKTLLLPPLIHHSTPASETTPTHSREICPSSKTQTLML